MSEFDIKDPVAIFLITYSSIATLTIIVLLYYVYTLRHHCKRKNYSEVTNITEDLDQLHRASIPNRYEVNVLPPEQKPKLTRTRSVPLTPQRSHVQTEYDSVACRPKEHPTENPQAPLLHHYEKPDSLFQCDSRPRQCENIIEQVVASLSDAYTDASKVENLQEKFLLSLTMKLKEKNPKLYESIQSVTSVKHQYEEITNDEKNKRIDNDSEDDGTYQKYFPVKSADPLAMNFANDEAQGFTSIGSSDHLKFLVERRSGENRSNVDAPYLEAKRYKAKSDCPEQLRRLCQSQYSKSNVINWDPAHTSAEQIKSNIAEETNFATERSNSFKLRAEQVARALQKPPIPSKSRSRTDIL